MDENQQVMMAYLGGCTKHITFPDKHLAVIAVTSLTTCVPHLGQHHFAVTGDGRTLHMSESGYECLKSLGGAFRGLT